MNQNDLLGKINKSALELSAIQSSSKLYAGIVNEALYLTGAEYGALIVVDSGKLQKIYSSSPLLKLSKKGYLQKALRAQNIVVEQEKSLLSSQPQLEQHGIISEARIPLVCKKKLCGILLIYTTKKNFFTDKVLGILQIFHSIATLALAKAQLEEESKIALETRDRFISLASHELRTPLTSINGYIQLLHRKMKENDTPESRWVQELYIESMRMTGLVKELLDINRIKQGQFAFIFGDVSLYEVVQKAISRHIITHSDHPIVFENKILDNKHTVIGDFDKLTEMVSGILNNAVKFSEPQSMTTVSLARTKRTIIVTIQDSGKGMTKQDLAAIFEGFYETKHPGIQGMGMGLLLAKHIVTHHRGKLKVTSKKNKGTKVDVSLPSANF